QAEHGAAGRRGERHHEDAGVGGRDGDGTAAEAGAGRRQAAAQQRPGRGGGIGVVGAVNAGAVDDDHQRVGRPRHHGEVDGRQVGVEVGGDLRPVGAAVGGAVDAADAGGAVAIDTVAAEIHEL